MEHTPVVIIGAGPSGLATAAALKKNNIESLVIERQYTGYNVSRFPIAMTFFSSRELVELPEFPMTIPDEKPTREQYLSYLGHFARFHQIQIHDYTNVLSVKKENGHFIITSENIYKEKKIYSADQVVIASGALDHPRMLGVDGEELGHVSHYFSEVYKYIGHRVLVVGSGNGAVEAALKLYRAGAKVTFSHRNPELSEKRIKYWLYPDIKKRFEKKEIIDYPASLVKKIEKRKVQLDQNGRLVTIDADFVLALTGYHPPLEFLKNAGIKVDEKTSIPFHQIDTLESNIPGLFLAGNITGGDVSGSVFIENSRFHGKKIADKIKQTIK